MQDNSHDKNVAHPSHYGGDTVYETIKVMEAWYGASAVGDFCLCNVLKYISRAGKKKGEDTLTDLKKARWYLDRAIKIQERRDEKTKPAEADVQDTSETQ